MKKIEKKKYNIKTYDELREFWLKRLSDMLWRDVKEIIK